MDNRKVGYIISRSENEEGESKGGNAPFGTRLCKAKCSVLYPLSVRLRKIGVCEIGCQSNSRQKELGFCASVNNRSQALLFADRGYIKRYLGVFEFSNLSDSV